MEMGEQEHEVSIRMIKLRRAVEVARKNLRHTSASAQARDQ